MTFQNQQHWFETSSFESMKEVIGTHPGKIRNLIDREFTVVKKWNSNGQGLQSGKRAFRDIWRPGSKGIVCHLQFNFHQGWEVLIEYQGPSEPDFFDLGDLWTEVPLHEFLTHTKPLASVSGSQVPYLFREAANDADF